MQLVLPNELEQYIQRQIANGKYQSALSILLAGVHLLEQQENIYYQGRLQELQQEVQIACDVVQHGEIFEVATAMVQS